MDYLEQLQTIGKKSQEARIEKAKLEQKLQTLQDEQKKLQEELKANGVTEENLGETISILEEEIQISIQQAQEQLK